MYDPLSGEGLVCVNGRCISNKRKFQVHDERQLGLHNDGSRRRGQRQPPPKRKKIRPRHNGIPANLLEKAGVDYEDVDEDGLGEDPLIEEDSDEDMLDDDDDGVL